MTDMSGNETPADNVLRRLSRASMRWTSPSDFILTSVGYAVGLGNVWRFPILCQRHGSIFVLVYWLMVVVVGVPVLFLEMSIGQLAKRGPIKAFKSLTPILTGLGYSMVQVGLLFSFFYTVIVSWSLHYIYSILTSLPALPWASCNHEYNTDRCGTEAALNASLVSAANEFFVRHVLNNNNNDWNNFGFPGMKSTISLFFSWLLVALGLIKGIRASATPRIVAMSPYFLLLALGYKSLTLPGGFEGLISFFELNPSDFSNLLDSHLLLDAATQIIFSLGPSCGCVITLASYNAGDRPIFRDAFLVAIINGLTSMLCGMIVFAIIGYVTHEMPNTEIQGGPGLAFVLYPQILARMSAGPIWALLFFAMLVSMALSSIFGAFETVVQAVKEELGLKNTPFIVMFLAFWLFLAGIPFACPGGIHLLTLFNACAPSFNILVLCLTEIALVTFNYGLRQFLEDLKDSGVVLGPCAMIYVNLCWKFLTPLTISLLLIFGQFGQVGLDDYLYPDWVQYLGLFITLSTLVLIPIFAFKRICECKCNKEELLKLLRPTEQWRGGNNVQEMTANDNEEEIQAQTSV